MRLPTFLLSLLLLLFFASTTSAHPLAPSLWAVNEQLDGELMVTWKTPLKPVPGINPKPVFPPLCKPSSAPLSSTEGTARLIRWTIRCPEKNLSGSRFSAEGIKGSPTGILFRLELLDGRSYHQMLSSENNSYLIPETPQSSQVFVNYLSTGTEHLLTGIDHVLFVIVLTLLVGWGRLLIWTITLFTLGHSITLALTVLGYVAFPSQFVEALIALSIVLAAVELVRSDEQRLFKRRPWLMSGGFGLLHGMGFAGALSEVGLPSGDIPLALASFNIGIEIGQLMVIALFVLLWRAAKQITLPLPKPITLAPAYIIGSVSALWFWQRLGLEQLLGS